jgi:hypothetical protein
LNNSLIRLDKHEKLLDMTSSNCEQADCHYQIEMIKKSTRNLYENTFFHYTEKNLQYVYYDCFYFFYNQILKQSIFLKYIYI